MLEYGVNQILNVFFFFQASQTDDVKVQLQFIIHTVEILGGATSLGQLIPANRGHELHTLIGSLMGRAGLPQVKLNAEPQTGEDSSADAGTGCSLKEKVADVLHSLSTT